MAKDDRVVESWLEGPVEDLTREALEECVRYVRRGVHVNTVSSWRSGGSRVPGSVGLVLECALSAKRSWERWDSD